MPKNKGNDKVCPSCGRLIRSEERRRVIVVSVQRWQPTKKLTGWVQSFGVRPLMRSLGVTRDLIYAWLHGQRAPHQENARKLLLLSQQCPLGVGPLKYEDIYGPVERL